MAGFYDGALQNLIDELGRLPGVGPKSAQRIAFFILSDAPEHVNALADALVALKTKVHFCQTCGNVCEGNECRICLDPRRNQQILCVVEEPKDVVAIERTREYHGLYHVLGGVINPIESIGPEKLRIRELLERLGDGTITEVIIATNPTIEGEATATFLSRYLKQLDVTVTRLASGLPMGGDLEYADEMTIVSAFAGRREL